MAENRKNPWEITGGSFGSPVSPLEALKLRGMDFKVEKHPLKVNGFNVTIPGKMATIRMDTMVPLGVVGEDYNVKDYVESFNDTFKTLVGEGLQVENAGYFGNGERGFFQASMPDTINVIGTRGKDRIKTLLTGVTSHDGSMALIIVETAIRIICQNTFLAASRDASVFKMSAKHTANMDERIKAIRVALARSKSSFAKLADNVNNLASKGVDGKILVNYLNQLFPDNPKGENNTRTQNIREQVAKLYSDGVGQDLPGVKGTMWALYNGVTEYVDYFRSTRGNSDKERDSNRLESLFLGSGAEIKSDAMNLALEMAN